MKGAERPCSIKPQQASSRNVLQRSAEPAAQSGQINEQHSAIGCVTRLQQSTSCGGGPKCQLCHLRTNYYL
jgi:hypothetical protein